jgi:tetratricopeptide (TPR) repeat protein
MSKVLLFFLCISFQLSAQNKLVIDSLKERLQTEKNAISRVELYNNLAWEYHYSDIQLTDSFAGLAITLSTKEKYSKGIGKGFINKSFVYRNAANYPEAFKALRWALVQFVKTDDRKGYSAAYNNIASLHYMLSNHAVAQFYYFQSLRISEQLGDVKGVAKCFNNIGVVNLEQKQFNKALFYFRQCYKILEKLNDKNGMADCLNNIGSIYYSRNQINEAIAAYESSIEINEKLGDKKDVSTALHNIGLMYSNSKNYKEALNYYHRSLLLDEESSDIPSSIITYVNIADCYINLKMLHIALKYAKESLQKASDANLKTDIMNAYELMYKIEERNNNFKEALVYHEKFKQYSDSIYNIETSNKVDNLEEQYINEKKEKQEIISAKEAEITLIRLQEKEHAVTQYIFIIGLVLIIFVSLIYIVFFLLRKTKYS